MSITLKDLAKKSGYSIATVSRALSNIKTVKPKTREQILQVAQELGYHNMQANRRENCDPAIIMLIVGDIQNQFFLGNIKGIDDTLKKQGIKLAIFNSDYDPACEEEFVKYANETQYNGIIMVSATETAGLVSLLKKTTCPVVLANRTIRSMDLNTVCIDNYRGGYMATSYLIEEGHRKIAHLAGPANSTASQDRERGFRDALRDYDLTLVDAAIQYGNLKRNSGFEFGKYFISFLSNYTAVFCANDLMAASFCEYLTESGVSIPEDVSIICFDDSPANVSGPVKLTTISRDPYQIGQTAAEMMIKIMADGDLKLHKIIFPPTLSIRNSVRNIGG